MCILTKNYCSCTFKGTVRLNFLSFFFAQNSQTVPLTIGLKWFREIFDCKVRNSRIRVDNDYVETEF